MKTTPGAACRAGAAPGEPFPTPPKVGAPLFYQTTYTPPNPRPIEDYLYWVGLGMAQAAVITLALLRRRGIR
jgi:hypothetical protein